MNLVWDKIQYSFVLGGGTNEASKMPEPTMQSPKGMLMHFWKACILARMMQAAIQIFLGPLESACGRIKGQLASTRVSNCMNQCLHMETWACRYNNHSSFIQMSLGSQDIDHSCTNNRGYWSTPRMELLVQKTSITPLTQLVQYEFMAISWESRNACNWPT